MPRSPRSDAQVRHSGRFRDHGPLDDELIERVFVLGGTAVLLAVT